MPPHSPDRHPGHHHHRQRDGDPGADPALDDRIGGSGGVAEVAPIVSWAFCESEALIWTPLRAFGAGFGIGTVCAAEDVTPASVTTPTMEAAISHAKPRRMPPAATNPVIPGFRFLFNTWSCQAFGYFIAISPKGGIVFCEKKMPVSAII